MGKAILDMHFPIDAMIVLIHRHGKYITANGDTIIEAQDHLLVMADNKVTIEKIYESFGIPVPH
jgi:cell volume regulation protein A